MGTFKKAVVLASILLLAACGESKISEVDGTSNAKADQSLKAMIKGIPDHQYIQWQVDFRMLKSRYNEGDQFAKLLDGKDLEEIKPLIADTKTHFIKINRARHIAVHQVEIDKEEGRMAARLEANLPDIFIQESKTRISNKKQFQAEIMALSDEEIWKKYGCGCERSTMRETAKY